MSKEKVEPVTISKFKELVQALPLKERVYIEQWLDSQREVLICEYEHCKEDFKATESERNQVSDELNTCIRCLRIVRYSY